MNQLPKYHETFMPILKVLNEIDQIHYNDLRKMVRDRYYSQLPEDLLKQTTKDGDQLILNRIGWGKAYLKQAGMVSQPARAMVQITEKGKRALATGSLTLQDLKTDDEFLAHRERAERRRIPSHNKAADDESPQDMIDQGVESIENEVKAELLEKVKTADPFYFEQVVCDLFEAMGYGGAQTTVKTGDGGVDGIINQDELGLEKIYIQAKRYGENSVREKDIRNFIGAMSGDTTKGIFVTTSYFDAKAVQKAKEAHHTIILIDGQQLSDLMYRFDVGMQVANTYVIKEIKEDYFV